MAEVDFYGDRELEKWYLGLMGWPKIGGCVSAKQIESESFRGWMKGVNALP